MDKKNKYIEKVEEMNKKNQIWFSPIKGNCNCFYTDEVKERIGETPGGFVHIEIKCVDCGRVKEITSGYETEALILADEKGISIKEARNEIAEHYKELQVVEK